MLHRFTQFLVACTVILILAGSLVTSHDAGLSVPDWPTSYGWNMFTFPPSMWVANILYEHGHRLIASTVGFLTIVLAVWLWIAETGWLRWLGIVALGTVIAQGVLGGITVLFFLPPAVSTAHAGLAEIFFCLTVAIALFTSPGWKRGYGAAVDVPTSSAVRTLATTTTALIYAQILIGATMRHTGAGLAIPDFPLMFGGLVPDHWDPKIAVHFAHRVGALVVTLSIFATLAAVLVDARRRGELLGPALVLDSLVIVQIVLGAATVLTRRNPWINSFHVVCGALVLTTSLVLTLRSWRESIADCGLRSADSRLRSADSGLRSADSGLRSADSGLRSADSGLRSADSALRSADSGLRSAESGLRSDPNRSPQSAVGDTAGADGVRA